MNITYMVTGLSNQVIERGSGLTQIINRVQSFDPLTEKMYFYNLNFSTLLDYGIPQAVIDQLNTLNDKGDLLQLGETYTD